MGKTIFIFIILEFIITIKCITVLLLLIRNDKLLKELDIVQFIPGLRIDFVMARVNRYHVDINKTNVSITSIDTSITQMKS